MSEDTAFEVGRLYEPIKRIADTFSQAGGHIFDGLPGLAAYWIMSARPGDSGAVADHAGTAPLAQVGTVPSNYDGNSYLHLGDGTNYLTASATLGLTGLETFVSSSIRGVTLGGWFMVDTLPTEGQGLISKDAASPERGYALIVTDTPTVACTISGTGASIVQATSSVVTLSAWHFIVGRFIPSTEVAIFVDGDKTVNTTAVPASVNVSTQQFEIGRRGADNNKIIHAKVRDVFVCAAALSDQLIEEIRVTSMP